MTVPKLSPAVAKAVLAYQDALRKHHPTDGYDRPLDTALMHLEDVLLAEPAPAACLRKDGGT